MDEYVIEHINVLLIEYKKEINKRLDDAISKPIQKTSCIIFKYLLQ